MTTPRTNAAECFSNLLGSLTYMSRGWRPRVREHALRRSRPPARTPLPAPSPSRLAIKTLDQPRLTYSARQPPQHPLCLPSQPPRPPWPRRCDHAAAAMEPHDCRVGRARSTTSTAATSPPPAALRPRLTVHRAAAAAACAPATAPPRRAAVAPSLHLADDVVTLVSSSVARTDIHRP